MKILLIIICMLITRSKISSTRFLYLLKDVKASNIDNKKIKNTTSNIRKWLARVNILWYKLVSFVFNINTFDKDLYYKI